MKNLLEIFQIIYRGNPEKIELLDKAILNKGNSKFAQFYEGLATGKIKSDLEAAQLIYKASPTDPKYRQLKSRFRKRLFNTLFLLDATDTLVEDENRNLFVQMQKQWSLTLIIYQHKARKTAISMARNLLILCGKYEFHRLATDIAHFLWKDAVLRQDMKNITHYETQRKKHEAFSRAEREAEEIFLKSRLQLKQKEEGLEVSLSLEKDAEKLVQLAEKFPSAEVYFYMYHIWILQYREQGNYRAMAQICRQAQKQIKNFTYWPDADKIHTFVIQEMYAAWGQKDLKAAAHLIEQNEKGLRKNFVIWLELMELYFLTASYTRDYTRMLSIYNRVSEQALIHEMEPEAKGKWQLFRAYLYLLFDCRVLKSAPADPRVHKEDMAHIRWDKNIKKQWKLLFLLSDMVVLREPDTAIFRANQGLKTQAKDFHNQTAIRRSVFLKLLERLHKADYSEKQLRLTDKYYQQLRITHKPTSTHMRQLEVIPYEHLWEILLKYFTTPR